MSAEPNTDVSPHNVNTHAAEIETGRVQPGSIHADTNRPAGTYESQDFARPDHSTTDESTPHGDTTRFPATPACAEAWSGSPPTESCPRAGAYESQDPPCSASVEWLTPNAGIIRIHQAELGQVGDPYVWCATLHRWCPSTVTIKGVMSPLPKAAARPFNDALYRQGLRWRTHQRAHVDGWRALLKPIKKPREATA